MPELRLSSGNGPVVRNVLDTPVRDALPHEVPVIDVSGIFSPDPSARQAVAQQIRSAALANGFFYIKNHGIPSSITSAAASSSLDFFRQPAELKEPANTARSAYKGMSGWKPPATQRINPFESLDCRESFSWRYDPKYDPSVEDVSKIPPHIAQYITHDADGFPWSKVTSPEHFKPAVIELWQGVLGLGRALLRSFALSLDQDEYAFDDKFTHPDVGMAINYYPPLPPSPVEKPVQEEVSIGSHTDFQLFTLLWQDPTPSTLQVLSREGQWLYAQPVEGTFVVNFGDYMQRITNDRYGSTVHRVKNKSGKERLSMAFFFGFNQNETVEVLDSCIDKEKGEKKKYEGISCYEWMQRRVKMMHDTTGKVGGY